MPLLYSKYHGAVDGQKYWTGSPPINRTGPVGPPRHPRVRREFFDCGTAVLQNNESNSLGAALRDRQRLGVPYVARRALHPDSLELTAGLASNARMVPAGVVAVNRTKELGYPLAST